MPITRHFVSVAGRDVHYRRYGKGPALVLLHASPVSSRVFEPAMAIFGNSFTCFAFDTPGNGLSDPLVQDDPDMADYAQAQIAALQALGIEKAIVYGRHTGASIAVEIARLAPELVTMAMTDGFPVFTPEQRQFYLTGYLEDLPTSRDGSHIPWLWNRYRDQFVFWPWSRRETGNRADCDMPESHFLHNGIVALLEAGNNYKAPYRAVFKCDAMASLEQASAPVCIAARPGDSLYKKLSDIPDTVWKEEMPRSFAAACAKELRIFRDHVPDCTAPELPALGARGFLSVDGFDVHFRRFASGNRQRPLALIGDVPGGLAVDLPSLALTCDTLAIDPLGAGESADGPADPAVQAALFLPAIREQLGDNFDVAGIGGGAHIALELARLEPRAAVTLIDPWTADNAMRAALQDHDRYDCAVRSDGTYMLRLWSLLRDQNLWFPFFDQRRSAVRGDAEIDWDRLEQNYLARLKHADALEALWNAGWRYDLDQALADIGERVRIKHTPAGLIPPAVHGKPLTERKAAL